MRQRLRRASILTLGLGIVALTLLPAGRVALGSDHRVGRAQHRLERSERRLHRAERRLHRRARHDARSHRAVTHGHRHHHHTRARSCGCVEVYQPAHWKTVHQRVRVPGCYERVWVPSRFETRLEFGCEVRVRIGGGYYKRVYKPAYYKKITKRVRVPGRYVLRGSCRH